MILRVILMMATVSHVGAFCVRFSDIVMENVYMRNRLLGFTKTSNVYDCAASCRSHHGCLSFGFEPRTHACHLHTGDRTTAPDDLVRQLNWIHGNISAFPKELWGPCSDYSCSAGQKCSVNRVTKRSVCVSADLDLPDDHCPALEVTNAVSSGGQEIGSSRNYTCLEGYLDTKSFLTSAVTTCLSDNTWSPLSLTCTGPFIKKTMSDQSEYHFEPIKNTIYGGTSSVIFWVKTCRDSNFGLCKTRQISFPHCIEIVVGGGSNTVCSIRPQIDNGMLEQKIISNVVSCTEFRPIWFSWSNDKIRIGKGSIVGKHVIVETHVEINIESVWYSCFKDNEATWLFLDQD